MLYKFSYEGGWEVCHPWEVEEIVRGYDAAAQMIPTSWGWQVFAITKLASFYLGTVTAITWQSLFHKSGVAITGRWIFYSLNISNIVNYVFIF